MNDLRKRLETLFGRQPSDGLVRFIEAELAQATADALEAAEQLARDFDDDAVAAAIHELTSPDIAAKAKERQVKIWTLAQDALSAMIRCSLPEFDKAKVLQSIEEHDDKVRAKTITQCNEQTIKELKAGHCDIPGGKESLAEHDAKIRREAYLRCADDLSSLQIFKEFKSLHELRNKWANEPLSGGKADGGGK